VTGRLSVIGLGPGSPDQVTPEAVRAIEQAGVFFGYAPYLDRLALRPDQVRIASDNREELSRAKAALDKAASGASVAVVSGGDPGVFAMAAAVCEAVEQGPEPWRSVDVEIVPGVTAMLAVAARIGAPLGHDFCAISLSDNLKPWDVIELRLLAASAAGFVIALYNPISKARPWQLGRAFECLRASLPGTTPVIFGRAAGRPDERIEVVPLVQAEPERADMATCVIIGSAETRSVARLGKPPLVYTPRFFSGPSR
jgi:precorrin-3B C17-methyltransferase